MLRKGEGTLKPLLAGERDRLCELTTRAMVLGLGAMPEHERLEREKLAERLYVKPKGRKKQ